MIEYITEFIQNAISSPNVGPKWVMTWTPLFLTFFFFILFANGIGLVPIFDTIGLIDRFFLKTNSDSLINNLLHGGVTATGNFNVTAGLATVTFFAIIIAGVKKHGFHQALEKSCSSRFSLANIHNSYSNRINGVNCKTIRTHDAFGC